MSTYIWCEDSKSGFEFWQEIFKTIDDSFIVESKGGNSTLRIAAENIIDDGNQYYILIDCVMDNQEVLRETTRLRKNIQDKTNVSIINVHSFEFTLLSFEFLVQWIFKDNEPMKQNRQNIIEIKNKFVKLIRDGGYADELLEIKDALVYPKVITTEQLSARLLSDITANTGFATGKGKLGQCFINNCCERKSKRANTCGLDDIKPSSDEKKRQIIDHSVLKESFIEVGLL